MSVASPDPDSISDVLRARAVLEVAGIRHWPEATEEARDRVREALDAYTTATADGASYQVLNERHLRLHLSLVGLTGSARLESMAAALIGELKVALARIDRIRRNAHDQAGSHSHLLELLECGDVDAAVTDLEQHLAGADQAIRSALAQITPDAS